MAFDSNKFKSLVHYVCWRCSDEPSKLGAVKLNKILWLADFTRYYATGQSITGARYVKRQFGPVPSYINSALRDLEAEGVLSVREAQFHGYEKAEYQVHRKPDSTVFQGEELEIANRAIDFVCNANTAKSISEMSHDHIWQAAQEGEPIPYYTIFATPGEITEDEREWARQELQSSEE
jgi:hypothetical protein